MIDGTHFCAGCGIAAIRHKQLEIAPTDVTVCCHVADRFHLVTVQLDLQPGTKPSAPCRAHVQLIQVCSREVCGMCPITSFKDGEPVTFFCFLRVRLLDWRHARTVDESACGPKRCRGCMVHSPLPNHSRLLLPDRARRSDNLCQLD